MYLYRSLNNFDKEFDVEKYGLFSGTRQKEVDERTKVKVQMFNATEAQKREDSFF